MLNGEPRIDVVILGGRDVLINMPIDIWEQIIAVVEATERCSAEITRGHRRHAKSLSAMMKAGSRDDTDSEKPK